jgi:hypothetical protein
LQEFQHIPREILQEGYTQIKRLINTTQGVTKTQEIQFWYGILNRELKRRVWEVIMLQMIQLTLVDIFLLAK